MNKYIVLFAFFFMTLKVWAQTKKDYIINYASIAVKEMENAKIPASITLAQGILESRFGMSDLSSKSNNHFGIKCHNGWKGKKVYHDDDAKDECFRAYRSAEESFRDHSDFLTSKNRYADLFKLSIYDYKAWAKGLRRAGYATNPRYADHLIKIIEEEELYVFDRLSSKDVKPYIASLKNEHDNFHAKRLNKKPKNNSKDKPNQPLASTQVKIIGGPAGTPEDIAISRDIFVINDVRTVRSFEGDTPQKIANYYDISLKKLKKYNEWDEYFHEFKPGMKVYLQPKRSKSRNVAKLYHKVEPGETMYQIAQMYGIRTSKLYKRNLLNQDLLEQPHPGEMISLRKNSSQKPKLLEKNAVFQVENIKENLQQDPGVSVNTSLPTSINKDSDNNFKKANSKSGEHANNEHLKISTSDPFEPGQYPSTEPVEKKPKVLNQKEAADQGRAIIYDNTPSINQQPIEVYQPDKHDNTKGRNATNVTNNSKSIGNTQYHTVKKGETLYGLSKQYDVSIAQIKNWNHMTGSQIKVGQKLIIRK